MPLARGDTFGRYVVLEVLGAGGGGEVYRAEDTLLHRSVALKFLLPSDGDVEHDAPRARILREARAAARLNHPNVVSIFDVGEHDGVPYMAMELVPGRSLRAYVGAEDVPVERRLRWLADIALALDVAHKSGLVHRDVKPENVIVRDDGFVKVVDFGIARQTQIDPHGPTAGERTAPGSAGTPHYMSPEQIRNEPLDGRADQFAWGVTAYELLSGGAFPWDASRGALPYVAAVLGEDAAPLRERAGSVAPEIAVIVERAIRRSKDDRFATMQDVAHALDPLRSHSAQDVVRHVVSVLPPGGDFASQNTTRAPLVAPPARPRTATRALALLSAVLLAGGGLLLGLRERGPRSPITAPAPAAAPTPVTKLPLPSTTKPEAAAAFVEGMQSFRDGSITLAIDKLQKAVAADPSMAVAHLTLAPLLLQRDDAKARASYARARDLRTLLGERDQALLEALEPLLGRAQGDAAACAVRLSALVERYPLDAELWSHLQFALGLGGDFEAGMAAGKRALSIDPEFYGALATLGETEAYAGDLDDALLTLDRCIEKSGASMQCTSVKDLILAQRGECARLEEDGRRLIGANPSARDTYAKVADAMMARAAPVPAVKQMLEQEFTGLSEAARHRSSLSASFRLDVATGNFSAAEEEARDYEQLVAGDRSERWHAIAAEHLVALYRETGRPKEAAATARRFLESREGWTRTSNVEDEGISYDATPAMLAAEREGGLLDEASLVTKRAAWLASWEAIAPRAYRGYLWLQAYPDTVATAEDAEGALAAIRRYGAVPAFRPNRPALLGRVYLVADRLDEAMPHLVEDARSCTALRWPFAHVRALYWLGRGYEAKGQASAACEAYDDVVDLWGAGRPRSVTADEARKRRDALRCTHAARDR